MPQYIVSLSVLRYRVSRFFLDKSNEKKVLIRMKKISIDFPSHQLVRINMHHMSCRVFLVFFTWKFNFPF